MNRYSGQQEPNLYFYLILSYRLKGICFDQCLSDCLSLTVCLFVIRITPKSHVDVRVMLIYSKEMLFIVEKKRKLHGIFTLFITNISST